MALYAVKRLGDPDEPGSLAELVARWHGAITNYRRPWTPNDEQIMLDVRERTARLRDWGRRTIPIPRWGRGHLRRTIGVLSAVEPEQLGLQEPLESIAAEVHVSRRTIARHARKLKSHVIRLTWHRPGAVLKRKACSQRTGKHLLSRRRGPSVTVVRPIEATWDPCPRVPVPARLCPLLARVYREWIETGKTCVVHEDELGVSRRTRQRHAAQLEREEWISVYRQPGRPTRYGPARKMRAWHHSARARHDARRAVYELRGRLYLHHRGQIERPIRGIAEKAQGSANGVIVRKSPLSELNNLSINSRQVRRSGRAPSVERRALYATSSRGAPKNARAGPVKRRRRPPPALAFESSKCASGAKDEIAADLAGEAVSAGEARELTRLARREPALADLFLSITRNRRRDTSS